MKVGDTVRLYGYLGTFKLVAENKPPYDWLVESVRTGGRCTVMAGIVVEVNGRRTPLVSLPIVPPAEDWPYATTLVWPRPEDRTWPLCDAIAADPRFVIVDEPNT